MGRAEQLASVAVIALSTQVCWAQEASDDSACHRAFESAQVARQAGRLMESRAHLRTCTAPGCNEILRSECGVWLDQVNKDIPSLVLTIVDRDGAAVGGATVQLDGRTLADDEVGHAIEVEPGTHKLLVEAYGARAEKSIQATQGQKNQPVTVELPWGKKTGAGPPPKPVAVIIPAEEEPGFTTLETTGIVMIAAGGLGIALFAALGFYGQSEERKLRSADCKPRCEPSDVDVVRRLYAAADISLVAGAVIGAAGLTMFLAAPGADSDEGADDVQASLRLSPLDAALKVQFP